MEDTSQEPMTALQETPVSFWSAVKHFWWDALASLRTRRRLLVEVAVINVLTGAVLIFTPEPTYTASLNDAIWLSVMVAVHVLSFVLTSPSGTVWMGQIGAGW